MLSVSEPSTGSVAKAFSRSLTCERLVLRRRLGAVYSDRSEQRRSLQAAEEIEHMRRFLGGHDHVQGHFVVRIDLRQPHLHQLYIEGHNAIEIGKDARPTDGFALDQGVQQDTALEHLGI